MVDKRNTISPRELEIVLRKLGVSKRIANITSGCILNMMER